MWDNPDWYNHQANANKYVPKWEKDVNYSPDANPAANAPLTGITGNRVVRVYRVVGVGVLIQTMGSSENGVLFAKDSLAILTKEEIGYAPNI